MSEGLVRALDAHHRFEPTDGAEGATVFVPTGLIFDARVEVQEGVVRVESEVPTLDAAVEGETVAEVVEDGWFETFERRLEDIHGVARTEDVTIASVGRGAETVTVLTDLRPTPDAVADDVLAVVNYVEGTWVEGIIPGYPYVDAVQAVRERAAGNAGADGNE